jgi:hypothetical protein
VAVKRDDLLTPEIVIFVMTALVAGRLSREGACGLVTPWVEGTSPSAPLAEDGAQLIHGSDVIVGDDGREHHASTMEGTHRFRLSDDEVMACCQAWLARVGKA